jgi:hypothetical protein
MNAETYRLLPTLLAPIPLLQLHGPLSARAVARYYSVPITVARAMLVDLEQLGRVKRGRFGRWWAV